MATASATRLMLWTDLEGREVMGRWRLRRLVRPEGRTAWFEATATDGAPAMVSLTEALNDEEDLLARLRAAAEIRHPNVVEVREAHCTLMDDTPVVLAAMEITDENLGDVLRERALDATEALPLMDALLKGLAAIHARQLVHGRMEAASVLAMGDTVKLRSDCVQLAGAGSAARAAEDVRGVGRIVTQALTRRIPANENDPVLQLLPEPLGRSVRRALSGAATVEEVAALAGTRLVPTPMPKTAVVEKAPATAAAVKETKLQPVPVPAAGLKPAAPTSEASQEMVSVAVPRIEVAGKADGAMQQQIPTAAKVTDAAPVAKEAGTCSGKARPNAVSETEGSQMELLLSPRRLNEPDLEDAEEADVEQSNARMWQWRFPQRSAPYVIGAAVVLVLATIWILYGWLHRTNPPRPAVAAQTQQVPVVTRTAAAPIVKPSASPRSASSVGADRVWRVVVYTYRHRSQAEHKAGVIEKRYPQLQAGVYAARGGTYLVTLGGPMSRQEAFALRAKAERMGLPRDTYAQNLR